MSLQTEPTIAPPAVSAPGVGIPASLAPTSYLIHRNRKELTYRGLIDPVSDRLNVKKPSYADPLAFSQDVLRAARSHDVGKVLLYVTEAQWQELLAQGFVLEGVLDGFFRGEPAFLMGYLLNQNRRACGDLEREQAVVEAALATPTEPPPPLADQYRLVGCGPDMADQLARFYDRIFDTYPSPLEEPAFVRRLIESGEGIFRAVVDGGRIASAAAAEIDRDCEAAEITNCGTLPEYRGEGLMQILIADLEAEMERQGMRTLYSVARSSSFGMNRALRKAGYGFRGRLRGHSHIMGGYEDMHLWVRQLRGDVNH